MPVQPVYALIGWSCTVDVACGFVVQTGRGWVLVMGLFPAPEPEQRHSRASAAASLRSEQCLVAAQKRDRGACAKKRIDKSFHPQPPSRARWKLSLASSLQMSHLWDLICDIWTTS